MRFGRTADLASLERNMLWQNLHDRVVRDQVI